MRQLTEIPSLRQSVISALAEISNNVGLGGEYSLEQEIADAIDLAYRARKAGTKAGDPVSEFARQGELFGDETVADYKNATVMMLADTLNDNRQSQLKKVLALYNRAAEDSASGQMELFDGGVKSKEDIINDVLEILNYDTERLQGELDAARAQRKAAAGQGGGSESVQQDGAAGESRTRNEEANTEAPSNDGRGSNGSIAGREQGGLAQTESLNYQLSDEVDENGHQFVLNSEGTIEFGYIGNETGLTPAPILLSEGVIANPKTNAGYGLLHIEARHGEQIREAGYGSVLEFVEEVAKNYEVIRKGNDRDGRETYMLLLPGRHNNTLMVELSGDGTYWNINTAGIFKTSYSANRTDVYNRHTTANQSAETDEASLSGEQSGTTPSTRMNAPAQAVDNSAGKGSEVSSNTQGKNEENGNSSDSATAVGADAAEDLYRELGISEEVEALTEDGGNVDAFLALQRKVGGLSEEDFLRLEKAAAETDNTRLKYEFARERERREKLRIGRLALRDEFERVSAEQGEVAGEWKQPKSFKADEYAEKEKDGLRPGMAGVYHDASGYGVVTDGEVMVYDKDLYDKKYKGRTVATHKVKEADGNPGYEKGAVIDGDFPRWRSVIPSPRMTAKVDVDGMLRFVAGVEDMYRKAWEADKVGNFQKFDKWFAREFQNDILLLRMPDGTHIGMPYGNLRRLAMAAKEMGLTELGWSGVDMPLSFTGKRGGVLAMPMMAVYNGSVTGNVAAAYEVKAQGEVREQKVGDGSFVPTENEGVFVEAMAEHLNAMGVETFADAETGQRMLDEVNGKAALSRGQKRLLDTAPLIQKEGSPADISSSDGAKVLQNLNNLASELEKISSWRKNILSEIAKAIGAKAYGSSSKYATFTTKNGQTVTVRLGNHNAQTESFDVNGEANGISIVISKRANNGINNNGKAHLVEFFYPEIALRKAEGKPLAEIVRSIEQALYSGEYKDTTGLAEREEVNVGGVQMQKAAPVFYSNAERAVEGVKQEKATAEQWLAMIQKQGGLKAGEDKWLGLSDWLKSRSGESLTKREVLDFIRENQIRVEEVAYADNEERRDDSEKRINDALQDLFDGFVEESQEQNPDEIYMATHYAYAEKRLAEELGYDYWEKPFDAYQATVELNDELDADDLNGLAQRLGISYEVKVPNEEPINSTRLDYTTDGLENKREIALTVPTVEPYKEHDVIHFGDAGGGRAVAWVRFGETRDRDGKRVLVIDEIQSKRHQEGREIGYKDKDPNAFRRAVADLDSFKNEMRDKYGRELSITELFKKMSADEVARYDELVSIRNEANAGIPDAPFDKNWHELAMKRMLRYAAENGYDKVAWTTGEQQAERYDIGNVVSKINVSPYEAQSPTESDGHDLLLTLNDGTMHEMFVQPDGTLNADNGMFDGKNVSEVFGKGLAEKIMSLNVPTEIEGNGLRIGGEGMKGFYDEMLPRFMDKYGRKWGVKTEDVSLSGLSGRNGRNGLTMHAVDVTPEMKASVMVGQPMFFRTADGEAYGFTLDGRIYLDPRIATRETPLHEYDHLWSEALERANPEAWEHLKGRLRGNGDLLAYVKGLYPEIEDENELLHEVFSHFAGRRGAERLKAMEQAEVSKTKGVLNKARVVDMFRRLRDILREYWTMARDLFAGDNAKLKGMSAEDFADMAMADFVSGFNPREAGRETAEREVKNVVADSSKEKLPQTRQEALEAVKNKKRPFINQDQHKEIKVSNNAVRHSATQDHAGIDVQCMGVIDRIINNAVKIGEIPVDADEQGHTNKVEVYYCPVNIDGTQYSARLVVKQYENRGKVLDDFQLFDLHSRQEKTDASYVVRGENALTPTSASVQSGYKVKELVHSTQAEDRKLLGLDEEGEFNFSKAFRRNRGYTWRDNGTALSVNADYAEQEGKFTPGRFRSVYKVSRKGFDILSMLGVIRSREWHHTGQSFKKSDFFEWGDFDEKDYAEGNVEPGSMADIYREHKKELDSLAEEFESKEWQYKKREVESYVPTYEKYKDEYVRDRGDLLLSDEERDARAAEHERISRLGEAIGSAYERRLMHEGVDAEYEKLKWERVDDASLDKAYMERYGAAFERNKGVDKRNAEIDAYNSGTDGKERVLHEIASLFGVPEEQVLKEIRSLRMQEEAEYFNRIRGLLSDEIDDLRQKNSARQQKYLKKLLSDGRAKRFERVRTGEIPPNSIVTAEEMNGRYGWFEANSVYNLPVYSSGVEFKDSRTKSQYEKKGHYYDDEIAAKREKLNRTYDDDWKAERMERDNVRFSLSEEEEVREAKGVPERMEGESLLDYAGRVDAAARKKAVHEHIDSMASRYGTKGHCISQAIHDEADLAELKKVLDTETYERVERYFHDAETGGVYMPGRELAVIFTGKFESAEAAELSWWHEQTHHAYKYMSAEMQERYGKAAMEYLEKEYPKVAEHIKDKYEEKYWQEESVAYFAEETIRKHGAEKFLSSHFDGNADIANLAAEIQKSLKYGRERENSDKLRRNAEAGKEGQLAGDADRLQLYESGGRGEGAQSGESERSESDGDTGRLNGEASADAAELAAYDAGRLSLAERAAQAVAAMSAKNRADVEARREAVKALGGNLQKLRQAMARQREVLNILDIIFFQTSSDAPCIRTALEKLSISLLPLTAKIWINFCHIFVLC